MQRPPPTEAQIAQAFRSLADAHACERAKLSRERAWRRVQVKWQGRVRERSSGWLIRADWRVRVGALAAFAAALALILWPADDAPLTYTVAGDGAATADQGPADADDGWIRSGRSSKTVDFSDGSSVELSAESQLNLSVTGKHSAVARLSSGKLTARVHHADETNWSFLAGPFEVRVVGTSFDMAWDQSQLDVVMHEGAVQVTGPGNQHWALGKGETLTVAAPTEESAPTIELDTAEEPAPELAETSAEPVTPHKSRRQVRTSWSSLLSKGHFSDIVSDAQQRGVEHSLGSESAAELAALAQAASYTGEAALAERTWLGIRQRFAGSQSAQHSAFFLARLKEQRGQDAEALRWLNTYLNEAPAGVYAAETQGRRLVLARRMYGANSAKARSLARAYLERYPEGAYAETARATLAHR